MTPILADVCSDTNEDESLSFTIPVCCSFRNAGRDPPADWVQEFRELVGKQIVQHWPKDKAKAQEASDLLDRGNRLLIAFERSGRVPASTSGASSQSADESFWDLPPSHWQALLGLRAERGPGPATLPTEDAGGRRRCGPFLLSTLLSLHHLLLDFGLCSGHERIGATAHLGMAKHVSMLR